MNYLKDKIFYLLIINLFFYIPGLCDGVSGKEIIDSKEPAKQAIIVKEFYLGMPVKDALNLIKNKYSNVFKQVKEDDNYIIIEDFDNYYRGSIFKKDDGIISEIRIGGIHCNLLFNSKDMTVKEFAQEFIDAYNIPRMEVVPTDEWNSYHYVSPAGELIEIGIIDIVKPNKVYYLKMKKVPQKTQRNFD